MEYSYESIRDKDVAPMNAFIHSVDKLKMHWHSEMEIILVLKGSINIMVGSEIYVLKENDLIVINSNEIHNTSKTMEDNILLVLQIDHNVYNYPEFNKMIFNCKSFNYGEDEQEKFDVMRYHLANILWNLNKRKGGYQFIIGSEVNLIAAHLINNFNYSFLEEEKVVNINRDINRLNSIVNYIDRNLVKGITLQEIADNENLNLHYTSHFIKKIMGISFQEYINILRLDKAVDLLSDINKTITEISYESGFPSTKSFNNIIKRVYNCSPTEYRKKYTKVDYNTTDMGVYKTKSKTYLDVDRNTAFKKILSYLEFEGGLPQEGNISVLDKEYISVNSNKKGIYNERYWKKLITFGRAVDGLRSGWQNQFRELQEDIGFEYVRFHGIFSDEMMICNINDEGDMVYNWSYLDELFDFFKEVNIKPFIELGFMPSELMKTEETVFWWKGNISQPRDIRLWIDLVKELVKHCINRYGLKEVETWYFEVWNEPDLENVFWIGGKEEYFQFYKETVNAVKSISNKIKVGGPSITHQAIMEEQWLEDFLGYCHQGEVPLDFVSLHVYPESYSSKKQVQDIMTRAKKGEDMEALTVEWKGMKRIYFDKDHTYDTLNSANDKINIFPSYSPEIHITEWNASAFGRNLIHDTCFTATFIIRNILRCMNMVDSLGYWTFTDIMEEAKAGISHFHGGFGLINKEGLKKASYFAYYLLSKLGEMIIEQGEEYIVTKSDESIQVLAYNYAYYDDLFLGGDTSLLTSTERYLVFEDKLPKEVEIHITGLSGNYKMTRYKLNREHGSVFDQWVEMGAPENMTKEEKNYLKGKSYPKMNIKYLDIDGKHQEKLYIPVHGVELIILDRKL